MNVEDRILKDALLCRLLGRRNPNVRGQDQQR